MNHNKLEGKVAIVTGGAMGIGKAVAERLSVEGSSVVVADRNIKEAEKTAETISSHGGNATAYFIDLSELSGIQGMIEYTVKKYNQLNILVNVAGIVQNMSFLDLAEEDWDKVIDVNQKSVVFCIQAAVRQMLAQNLPDQAENEDENFGRGKIVNFSSISGRRGRALQVHYAASKAAVISITQSAALAFAPYNINVNAISPSVVKTSMWEKNVKEKSEIFGIDALKESEEFIKRIPLQRAGRLREIAGAAAFLCSPDADYITGQTLNVDGGFEMN